MSSSPPRRAPRAPDEAELRVDGERAPEHRDLLGAVRLDGEVRERRVRLPRRPVVVAVVRAREVRGAHRRADEAEADPPGASAEQLLQQRLALLGAHLLLDEVGGGVGHAGAPADDRLEAPALVDRHRGARRVVGQRAESDVLVSREEPRPGRRGDVCLLPPSRRVLRDGWVNGDWLEFPCCHAI